MNEVTNNPSGKVGWDKLIKTLSGLSNELDMANVCDFLFTHEEREQLGKRMLLTQALINPQKSQRDIAKEIGVSICTVTRCSNALKSCNDKIKTVLK